MEQSTRQYFKGYSLQVWMLVNQVWTISVIYQQADNILAICWYTGIGICKSR